MELEAPAAAGEAGLPLPAQAAAEELGFFEKLRTYLRAFPPSAAERAYQKRFAPLGLLAEQSPYATPSAELRDALLSGFKVGKERVENHTVHGGSPVQNGWNLTYHAFDYNLAHFGLGTLDDPQWVIQDRDAARLERAASARAGLWGNHGYEAAYAMTWTDGAGQALDGMRAYTLRFKVPPPVDGFWSVTMYNLPEYFLVANPIDRYSIGDRTSGLHYEPDGALTLHLRPDAPTAPEARANWLPTLTGAFRPILRMYQPRPEVFNGGFTLPPITPA
ncbi:DUF1214 domain-containing protein [Streptomyces sp. NPDC046716]|uniref:DUF1214 domain-containing protein n=1 Tax=Streptomyces sp. NPDC046716 TaxID=3157093 RepID=UPI003404F1FB